MSVDNTESLLRRVSDRNPGEKEFLQSVGEVMESIIPWIEPGSKYDHPLLLEYLAEPERIISFRVVWEDDSGALQLNRGWRVQFSSALGPYKGGLRFSPSVTPSILKFLGFEQCFKNALTGLPLGGGKGGSDFDPKGKSDAEVRRFCRSFMTELARHIGPDTDVPAGDIGVGARELGYLYGQYRTMTNSTGGALTGKGVGWGGSRLRTEATGYGVVYFAEHMLNAAGRSLEGLSATVSGSGNVSLYCVEKLLAKGVRVLSLSDSDGTVFNPDGISEEQLAWVKVLKQDRRGRISEYADKFGLEYHRDSTPWEIACDIAFPCATQNELNVGSAQKLVDAGCRWVVEGANMPTTHDALKCLHENRVRVGPAKAANAGGVAVSGLEMSQNSQRQYWSADRVDNELQGIMRDIHEKCVEFGREDESIDYPRGANIAGFVRLADAVLAQGLI